jgi:hypothetical protein
MLSNYRKHLKAIRPIILASIKRCFLNILEHERWVYNHTNRALVEHIEEGLKQKPTIYRGSLAKRIKL